MTDLAHDYLDVDSLLTADERALRGRVRAFVDERIRPDIARWYETAHFPAEIAGEMGALGLLGMHLEGYGCAGRSAVEYGLAALELEAGDSGLRTFVSVHGSLAMSAVHKFGSEEHKQRWLPGMAAGELIGCFGLTEPTAGSDPASMRTRAVRDGDHWVIDGAKRWIGLASIADVAVIWARTDEGIRGFVVPGHPRTRLHRHPDRAEGRHARLDSVRHHPDRRAGTCRRHASRRDRAQGPVSCLNEARYGIMWGAIGAARDAYQAALGLRAGPSAVRRADRGVPAHPAKARRHGAGNPRKACWSPCIPGASRTPAGSGPSRSASASSTTSVPPSLSAVRPAPSSAATASRWTTHPRGTPATWKACAPTRAPTRSTP